MEQLRAYDGGAYRQAAQDARDAYEAMIVLDPAIDTNLLGDTGVVTQQLNFVAYRISSRTDLTPERKRQAMVAFAKAVSGIVHALTEVETPNTGASVRNPGPTGDLETDRHGLRKILDKFVNHAR